MEEAVDLELDSLMDVTEDVTPVLVPVTDHLASPVSYPNPIILPSLASSVTSKPKLSMYQHPYAIFCQSLYMQNRLIMILT